MTNGASFAREGEDLALLTGSTAGDMLRGAVGTDAVLRSWQVHSVHHRPGAGITVGYTVTVDRQSAAGTWQRQEEYLCASTARLAHASSPHLTHLRSGDTRVAIWTYPEDPELPGLPTACSPARMAQLLGHPVSIELMSYRPTRRAVVRVTDIDGSASYGKVLRPPQAQSLAKRHMMLERAGVAAPSLLLNVPSGIVLVAGAEGEPLANAISRGMGSRAAQILGALSAVLDSLPTDALTLTKRPAWAERATHYAHAAATALPEQARRCRAIALEVSHLLAASDPGPLVPVHGDFYEANIYVDVASSAVTGLIDIDSLGPGHRVDDWACLLGHMSVLPHLAPRSYPHVASDLPTWRNLCERMVDPVSLCARTAGVVLSLVAGAKRVDGTAWKHDAEGRLATAEAWLTRARIWASGRIPVQ
ncbi:phosphotransferase [Actinobaculum sp. 313]|uniref:phosphotransferase family protein n=1 Tax=Actinobaculum sp. 313 TaxID=2495645 RepID=UPI000D525E98|nr:phosphotransferase [Actinobaculum sp. 313]AWE41977.1 phosphotransferase [Actinobaculum sp. 313]